VLRENVIRSIRWNDLGTPDVIKYVTYLAGKLEGSYKARCKYGGTVPEGWNSSFLSECVWKNIFLVQTRMKSNFRSFLLFVPGSLQFKRRIGNRSRLVPKHWQDDALTCVASLEEKIIRMPIYDIKGSIYMLKFHILHNNGHCTHQQSFPQSSCSSHYRWRPRRLLGSQWDPQSTCMVLS